MTDFDTIWDEIVKGTVGCPVCNEAGDTNEVCPLSSPDTGGNLRTMGNCDRRINSTKLRPAHKKRERQRRKKERGR